MMSSNEERAVKAALYLKEFCRGTKGSCKGCIFLNPDISCKILIPENYEVREEDLNAGKVS